MIIILKSILWVVLNIVCLVMWFKPYHHSYKTFMLNDFDYPNDDNHGGYP